MSELKRERKKSHFVTKYRKRKREAKKERERDKRRERKKNVQYVQKEGDMEKER